MSVTDANGERVYCRVLDNLRGPASGLADLRRRKGRLLSQPIGLLLDQVEQAAFDSALRATDRASAEQSRQQVRLHAPVHDSWESKCCKRTAGHPACYAVQ